MSDDRTLAIGLFNYAHSYFECAEVIYCHTQDLNCTHPDAPMSYLYAHAIELYLKSFLRIDLSINDIKNMGHKARKLLNKSISLGLDVNEVQQNQIVLGLNSIEHRYIQAGHTQRLSREAYSELCKFLHNQVGPEVYDQENLLNVFSSL